MHDSAHDTHKDKILSALAATDQPVSTEHIRQKCGIGNWNTALKHCLELHIENTIDGVKTGNGWIFWIEDGETYG